MCFVVLLPVIYNLCSIFFMCCLFKQKQHFFVQARVPTCQAKLSKLPPPKGEDNTLDEDTLCGACGENYASDEFWICCDTCKKWFHGKCLKITPAIAEHIKHYKCPSCSNKRPRI